MHVSIIGCGQLARMLALAGWNMGLNISFLADENESTRCVRGLGRITHRSPEQSAQQVYIALGEPDVITVEREHVDAELLRALTAYCQVHPDPDAVRICQDRLREKHLFTSMGLATADFVNAHTQLQVADAAQTLGLPVIIKSRTASYDGKGQWRIRNEDDLRAFCTANPCGDWLVEKHIAFEREISVLAARSTGGNVAFYPPTENSHHNGILMTSIAPAVNLPEQIQARCHDYMHSLLNDLDYVGVLAMECFVTPQGLLVNELAPRVHNSGHWTLRSEATSQFENHLRAICGLPLGDTSLISQALMFNLLGVMPTVDRLAPGMAIHWHDYRKAPRAGRKIGHVTVTADTAVGLQAKAAQLAGQLGVAAELNLESVLP